MDQYHFYDEIGKGRHSQVYKGRQKKTVEYVAIKRVDKALMDRVVNEVQVMHRLNSPHTLRFHNWYETRNNLWLILEYCTGGDMLSLLNQDGRLPEAAVKVFGVDLMTGLQYLHRHGYLFCDLKPSNVLVDEYGVVKLSDFGLSRRIPTPNAAQTQSTPRKKGTPFYMAPELFLEQGVHSYKSELWSLGCMLFELYVGKPPWTSTSLNELIRSILHDPFEFPPELKVSREFRDLLSRLLAKDPLKRADWSEALSHEFWSATLPPKDVPLPPEPLYEAMLPTMRAQLPLTDESLNESTLEESSSQDDTRGSSVLDESTYVSANQSTLDQSSLLPPSPYKNNPQFPPQAMTNNTCSNQPSSLGTGGKVGRADIVRMSAGARMNHGGGGEDVTLNNRDVEIDFDVGGPTSQAKNEAESNNAIGYFDAKMIQHQAGLGHGHQNMGVQIGDMNGGGAGAGSSLASEGGFGGSESEESDDMSPQTQPGIMQGGQRGALVGDGSRSGNEAKEVAAAVNTNDDGLNLSVRSSHHGSLSAIVANNNKMYEQGKASEQSDAASKNGVAVGGGRAMMNEANLSKLKSKSRLGNNPEPKQTKAANEVNDYKNDYQPGAEPSSRSEYNTATPEKSQKPIAASTAAVHDYAEGSKSESKGGNEEDINNHSGESGGVDGEDEYWAWEEEVGRAVSVSQLAASGPGDLSVRPITLNKFIEMIDPPEFDVACLPFKPLAPQQLVELPPTELEDYLTSVYKSLATKDIPVSDKVHVLSYLYRISTIDVVANIVINSSFAPLLLKMAKRFKSNNLRALVVTLLGLLVRHAILVVPDRADGNSDEESDIGGIISVMLDLLKEPNIKLRRRAMATLGELLFYVHTLNLADPHAPLYNGINDKEVGVNGGGSASSDSVRWYVPGNTVPSVARCLQEGEDEIVCHYASKTVENILAQASPIQCRRFASLEIGLRLADLALRSQRRSDALHATATSALAHFLRRVLLPEMLDSNTPQLSSLGDIPAQEGSSVFSPERGASEVISNGVDGLNQAFEAMAVEGEMPNSQSPAPPMHGKHFQVSSNSNQPLLPPPAASATVAAGQPGAGGAPGPRLVARIFERNGGGGAAIAEGILEPSNARVQVAFVTMVVALFWESGDGDQDSAALLNGGVWPTESPRSPHAMSRGGSFSSVRKGSQNQGSNAAGALAGRPLRQLRLQLIQANNSKLLVALVKCVERGLSPSARAKAMVALRVVCARHPHALVQVLDRGLLLKLDKLVSSPSTLESNPYLRSCALQLFVFIVTHAVDTTALLTDECYKLVNTSSPDSLSCYYASPYEKNENHGMNQPSSVISTNNNEDGSIATTISIGQKLSWYLSSFPAVSHLIAAQCVNETLVAAPHFLDNIVRLLEFTCDSASASIPFTISKEEEASRTRNLVHDAVVPSRYDNPPSFIDSKSNHSKGSHSPATTSSHKNSLDKRKIDAAFVAALGAANASGGHNTINHRGDLQQVLLLTLQGLCKNVEILLPQRVHYIASKLLPCLCRVLIEANSDARANTITLLRLLLPPLLHMEGNHKQQILMEFIMHHQQQQQQHDFNHRQISELRHQLSRVSVLSVAVERFLLPILPMLIADRDPIPHFVLSLAMEIFHAWKATGVDVGGRGELAVAGGQRGNFQEGKIAEAGHEQYHLLSGGFAEAMTLSRVDNQPHFRAAGGEVAAVVPIPQVSLIDQIVEVSHRSPSPQVLSMARQLATSIRS